MELKFIGRASKTANGSWAGRGTHICDRTRCDVVIGEGVGGSNNSRAADRGGYDRSEQPGQSATPTGPNRKNGTEARDHADHPSRQAWPGWSPVAELASEQVCQLWLEPCRAAAARNSWQPCGPAGGTMAGGKMDFHRPIGTLLRSGDMRCRTVRTGPKRYGVRSQRVRADRSGAASDRQRPPRPAPSRKAMDASTAPLHRRCLSRSDGDRTSRGPAVLGVHIVITRLCPNSVAVVDQAVCSLLLFYRVRPPLLASATKISGRGPFI